MTRPTDGGILIAGASDPRPVLITGGAGFVGSNLAHHILKNGKNGQDGRNGQAVRIFDNLSRPGVEQNIEWLRSLHGDNIEVIAADIGDRSALRQAIADVSAVFHLAAQVAVTTSLEHPEADFEVNLRGTLNVLEELRALAKPPPLVFTSTNKVYGTLDDLALTESGQRYYPQEVDVCLYGIGEHQGLCMRSPYGCSKGAADQYVLDYAKTFGLRTLVFRMSCIYGPHQFGNEEQGWVAHFALRALQRSGIVIYGDGKQVRDILFVDDLAEALLLAMRDIDRLSGRAFNIGGGPGQEVSLLDVISILERLTGERLPTRFAPWRPGDQRYYVSDIREFYRATGWQPRTTVQDGIAALYDWLQGQQHMGNYRANSPRTASAKAAVS